MPGFYQAGNHGDDSIDLPGCPRVNGRREDIQIIQVTLVFLDILFRQQEWIHALLVGTGNNLVIHIGEIHDKRDCIAAIFQVPADDVKYQRRHGMTNMRLVVDCWSADIHADFPRFNGFKFFFLPGERIINFQSHC